MHFAVEGEDQRDGVFGDGVGRIGRDAGDGEAVLGGGVEVDVVESGASQDDQFDAEGGQFPDDIGAEQVIDKDADGRMTGGEAAGWEFQPDIEEGQVVVVVGGFEETSVIGFGTEDSDTHKAPSVFNKLPIYIGSGSRFVEWSQCYTS